MKKPFKLERDHLIVALLVVLLLTWGMIYSKLFAPPVPATKPIAPMTATGTNAAAVAAMPGATNAVVGAPVRAPEPPLAEIVAAQEEPEPDTPATEVYLTNAVMRIAVSSHGACITAVELQNYRTAIQKDSPPVRLDFKDAPAIALTGMPGLTHKAPFDVMPGSVGQQARFSRTLPSGLHFERTITLTEHPYRVKIDDAFRNDGVTPLALSEHALQVGPMGLLPGEGLGKAEIYLGLDSLAAVGGEGVRHWNSSSVFSKQLTLAKIFQPEIRRGGCAMNRARLEKPLPVRIAHNDSTDVDWLAAKNKFFVQILQIKTPAGGGNGFQLQATRRVPLMERADDSATWAGDAMLESVAGTINFDARTIAPGETFTRQAAYYVGPREYASVRNLGNSQDEVMEFGMWSWLCKILVVSLKWIYRVIPNYGVAIILLTFIIRLIFWPVTHRGTESMKKMQALQPQMKELREKFKDKPQKLQQEMMALYKEHKVNPFLGGCLPMLIQIPVFIALYNILRSDIGLRFAGFLWVADLSEAENLLVGTLPFGLALNLLPIYMAVTMAWQQKLTPAAGDPAQQKMMMFMPLIMLLFFYSLPSGMVLYWSVNQTMMIVQLLWQKRRSAA